MLNVSNPIRESQNSALHLSHSAIVCFKPYKGKSKYNIPLPSVCFKGSFKPYKGKSKFVPKKKAYFFLKSFKPYKGKSKYQKLESDM